MEFKSRGSIIDYNPYLQTITFKCNFLTSEILEAIETVIKEKRESIELKFNFTPRRSVQDYQRRCWYGSTKLIMMANGIELTSENMKIEDEEFRKSIFPCKTIEVDGKRQRQPKRMHELSLEEMQRCLEVLHERHQHLKINGKQIDFSDLKMK